MSLDSNEAIDALATVMLRNAGSREEASATDETMRSQYPALSRVSSGVESAAIELGFDSEAAHAMKMGAALGFAVLKEMAERELFSSAGLPDDIA